MDQIVEAFHQLAENNQALMNRILEQEARFNAASAAVENRMINRPKIKVKIPYGGSSNPKVIESFINSINTELRYYQVDNEEQKILAFGSNLVSTAQNWYTNFTNNLTTDGLAYEDLLQAFKTRFYPTNVMENAIDRFETLVQVGSVGQFIAQFTSITEHLPAHFKVDAVLKDRFISKVKPEIKRYIKITNPQNLQEVYRDARRAEDTIPYKGFAGTGGGNRNFMEADDPMDIDQLRPVECWNCHQTGHISRYCPDKKQGKGRGKNKGFAQSLNH